MKNAAGKVQPRVAIVIFVTVAIAVGCVPIVSSAEADQSWRCSTVGIRNKIVPNLDYILSDYDWDHVPCMLSLYDCLYVEWKSPNQFPSVRNYFYTEIQFKVKQSGEMHEFVVISSSGPESLHGEAMRCLRILEFLPPLPATFVHGDLVVLMLFEHPHRNPYLGEANRY